MCRYDYTSFVLYIAKDTLFFTNRTQVFDMLLVEDRVREEIIQWEQSMWCLLYAYSLSLQL